MSIGSGFPMIPIARNPDYYSIGIGYSRFHPDTNVFEPGKWLDCRTCTIVVLLIVRHHIHGCDNLGKWRLIEVLIFERVVSLLCRIANSRGIKHQLIAVGMQCTSQRGNKCLVLDVLLRGPLRKLLKVQLDASETALI